MKVLVRNKDTIMVRCDEKTLTVEKNEDRISQRIFKIFEDNVRHSDCVWSLTDHEYRRFFGLSIDIFALMHGTVSPDEIAFICQNKEQNFLSREDLKQAALYFLEIVPWPPHLHLAAFSVLEHAISSGELNDAEKQNFLNVIQTLAQNDTLSSDVHLKMVIVLITIINKEQVQKVREQTGDILSTLVQSKAFTLKHFEPIFSMLCRSIISDSNYLRMKPLIHVMIFLVTREDFAADVGPASIYLVRLINKVKSSEIKQQLNNVLIALGRRKEDNLKVKLLIVKTLLQKDSAPLLTKHIHAIISMLEALIARKDLPLEELHSLVEGIMLIIKNLGSDRTAEEKQLLKELIRVIGLLVARDELPSFVEEGIVNIFNTLCLCPLETELKEEIVNAFFVFCNRDNIQPQTYDGILRIAFTCYLDNRHLESNLFHLFTVIANKSSITTKECSIFCEVLLCVVHSHIMPCRVDDIIGFLQKLVFLKNRDARTIIATIFGMMNQKISEEKKERLLNILQIFLVEKDAQDTLVGAIKHGLVSSLSTKLKQKLVEMLTKIAQQEKLAPNTKTLMIDALMCANKYKMLVALDILRQLVVRKDFDRSLHKDLAEKIAKRITLYKDDVYADIIVSLAERKDLFCGAYDALLEATCGMLLLSQNEAHRVRLIRVLIILSHQKDCSPETRERLANSIYYVFCVLPSLSLELKRQLINAFINLASNSDLDGVQRETMIDITMQILHTGLEEEMKEYLRQEITIIYPLPLFDRSFPINNGLMYPITRFEMTQNNSLIRTGNQSCPPSF